MIRLAPTIALIACLALASCEKREASAPDTFGTPTEVYTDVRGVVVGLPDHVNDLRIHHEHVPTFVGADGEVPVNEGGVPGMRAMQMPFPISSGVSLNDLAVGDKVAFTMQVNRTDGFRYRISELRRLEPDAVVDFADKTGDD